VAQIIPTDWHYCESDAVLLFLEDLEDIVDAMKAVPDAGPVEIRDEDYVYDSLDDLRKKRGVTIYDLRIFTTI
jgi:hypothetical protein